MKAPLTPFELGNTAFLKLFEKSGETTKVNSLFMDAYISKIKSIENKKLSDEDV